LFVYKMAIKLVCLCVCDAGCLVVMRLWMVETWLKRWLTSLVECRRLSTSRKNH